MGKIHFDKVAKRISIIVLSAIIATQNMPVNVGAVDNNVKGDANLDGTIDVRDLVEARNISITEAGKSVADMDGNGVIDETDLALIRSAILVQNKKQIDTYYVSGSGSDEHDGTKPENAFATVKNAIDKIQSLKLSEGIIRIVGEYDFTADDFGMEHDKKIVIEGNDAEAKLNITEDVYAKGNITFRNIVLNYPNGSRTIYANGKELVFGEGVSNTGKGDGWWSFQNMISTGARGGASYNSAQKLTVNTGDYYRLYVGESRIGTGQTRTIPGVDFTMNGGQIFQFILGGDGWDGMWGTNSFTKDVNLTFNGGSVGSSGITLSKYGVNNTYFQGGIDFNENALQIIMNNGTNISLDPGLTEENVKACNGKLYVLKCDQDVSCKLEVTDTEGMYKVKGSAVAVATDGTNTYKSIGGILEVPEGTYTVTWKDASVSDIVYVSSNGSDNNNGTSDSPLKTISAAISTLNKVESDEKTIILMGEVELPTSLTSHTDMITIRGDGEKTTQLMVKTGCELNGPITIETLAVNVTAYDKYFNTGGNKLVIGKNVTCANWINMYAHMGTYTSDGGHEEAIIDSGKFTNISIGSYYNEGYSYKTAGADLIVNGGTIQNINVFSDGWLDSHKGVEFTENVNITFNGGNFGRVVLTNEDRPTIYGKAVQIIINNGISGGEIPSTDSISPAGGYWVMRSNADGALSPTETAGEFKVHNGKTAVATSKNGNDVYISEAGLLKVPKAGEYNVEYSDVLYYTNSGEEIVFYEDCSLDLSGMKHTEKEGKLFIGWVDSQGNGVEGKKFTKDTILKAKYIDFDSANDFVLSGVQLKKTNANENQTMHFEAKIKRSAIEELRNNVDFKALGGLDIKSEYLGTAELELSGKYSFDGTEYTANNIVFIENSGEKDGYLIYDIDINDLQGKNYKDQYTVKGYIQYTDLNGYSHILYTEYGVGSVYSAAKEMLAMDGISDEDKAYYEEIKKYAEEALKEAYFSQKKTTIVPESGLNPYDAFYRLENGLSVREVSIDSGSDNTTPVEIVQATDFHYNYCNEKDFEENNPSTMSTYYNRGLNPNGSSVRVTSKCMEYGSFFDQTVVTGDILDYLSWGSLELMQKYIWDPYPDTLALLGNHDPVRVMGLPNDVPDPTTVASRLQILQDHWKHDIYYESRVIKDKVLVIQMDNGQNKFWDKQIEKLQADIARAKLNDYTVLIFLHVPLSTGNPNDVSVPYIYTEDKGSATAVDFYNKHVITPNSGGATKTIYDIITNNADIIKGVFTGHQHDDFYTEIQAKTSTGESAVIPQYTLIGSFYGQGHVMKITVK